MTEQKGRSWFAIRFAGGEKPVLKRQSTTRAAITSRLEYALGWSPLRSLVAMCALLLFAPAPVIGQEPADSPSPEPAKAEVVLRAPTTPDGQWARYMVKKERKGILKKSLRSEGFGAVFAGGFQASGGIMPVSMWVTDPVARSLVSTQVDEERLTPDEAEARYLELRTPDAYTLLLFTKEIAEAPMARRPKLKESANPVEENKVFLQRKDDVKLFSKGATVAHDWDMKLDEFGGFDNNYIFRFSKESTTNQPLVRGLTEKLELQFTLIGTVHKFKYELKDLVKSLEEL